MEMCRAANVEQCGFVRKLRKDVDLSGYLTTELWNVNLTIGPEAVDGHNDPGIHVARGHVLLDGLEFLEIGFQSLLEFHAGFHEPICVAHFGLLFGRFADDPLESAPLHLDEAEVDTQDKRHRGDQDQDQLISLLFGKVLYHCRTFSGKKHCNVRLTCARPEAPTEGADKLVSSTPLVFCRAV